MSPLYRFGCCGKEMEVLQGIDKDTPLCPECGAKMKRLPTSPAVITIKNEGGIKTHSQGYKEGYAKDYQRRQQSFQERKRQAKAELERKLQNMTVAQ